MVSKIMKIISICFVCCIYNTHAVCIEWADFCDFSELYNDKETLEKNLNLIKETNSGGILCGKLADLSNESKKKIKFKNGNVDEFRHGCMQVFVTLKECPNVEAIGKKLIVENGINKKQIGYTTAKVDEVIFHELVHAKHYLEQETKKATYSDGCSNVLIDNNYLARIKYEDAKSMPFVSFIQKNWRKYFPETRNDSKCSSLWLNLEERRTVNGPDIDGLCENAYRIEKNRPIRYIYQGKGWKFLEEEKVVLEYIGQYENYDNFFVNDVDKDWKPQNPFDDLLLGW